MSRGRSLLVLIVVPAVVSLLVTLLVLSVWDAQRASPQRVVVLPTHSGTAMIPPRATYSPTAPPAPPGASPQPTDAEPIASVPPCENPIHLVASGETLGAIATLYGVSIDDITIVNQQLDPTFDPNFLSIGQPIVIPLCGVPEPTATPVSTATLIPTRNIPTPIPTATEPPPGTVRVRIQRVLYPGDVTREAVEIVNEGSPVELEGWVLTNGRGDRFEFPPFRLFTGGGVTIFTGAGENTPIALYWGLTHAVWRVGDTVSLYDADGILQHEFDVTP